MTDRTDHTLFQLGTYFQGLSGEPPSQRFRYEDWHDAAAANLDAKAYGYVAGGSGREQTMTANESAFARHRIVPRHMVDVDVAARRTRVELFGQTYPSPLFLAPIGVQSIIHPEGELATARGAAQAGVPFILSTAASNTIEDVREAAGDHPAWFQLYWPTDDAVTASLVGRAEAAGYRAIVVTLDTKFLAWRPRDLDTAYLPFLHGEGIANYLSDAAFRASLDASPEENPQLAILKWAGIFAKKDLQWSHLAWLREQTSLPIVVKGIQHPLDAKAAIEAGADGLIVSNHGGRQVDGAVGALDCLADVRDAVGPDVAVLFDSGVRSGADVLKAVALGADAVCLGRPYAWGLGADGADGVSHVCQSILNELELTMALSGVPDIDNVNASLLTT